MCDAALRHEPPGPGRAARELTRHHDGSLYDIAAHRPVSLGELADDVRAGATFRARDAATNRDCTYQVLATVLAGALSWIPAPFGHGAVPSATIATLLGSERS
ncbi:polyhydroxyalkanoate synthesis regulator DNA-binding domain-containing protein [Streptomyces syringium]|uniref:polyhydroxyalkanoate synthesis regulator DNA-binding domain-containing protein n=1 Tax=Streptomyces syringium TaxID=76729 RepID=UPI0033A4DACD